MGNFIGGIFRTAGRLLTSMVVIMIGYFIGDAFFGGSSYATSQEATVLALGIGLPGLVYTINGVFFDALNWGILDNNFFRFIKKLVFYVVWVAVALIQVLFGGESLSDGVAGLDGGLMCTILFSAVIGVFYSIEGTLDDDFEGTWAMPFKMGGMAALAGIVIGILGSIIPFLGENLTWILPLLSNGGLLVLMITKGIWPYSEEAREAMWDSYGSSSDSGYSSYDDDDDDYYQDNRKEGGWGQLGDAMWAVAKRYDGNSYTLAYGDMRISVYQTTTGWNTLLYEVRVFIRPGYTCTDEYCFNQLQSDAERKIQEVQEEILSDGQDALRSAQSEYKAYDKNYKIEVRIVETKLER